MNETDVAASARTTGPEAPLLSADEPDWGLGVMAGLVAVGYAVYATLLVLAASGAALLALAAVWLTDHLASGYPPGSLVLYLAALATAAIMAAAAHSAHRRQQLSIGDRSAMQATATVRHEALARARFNAWATSGTFRRLKPWLAFVQQQVLDRIDWSHANAVLDVACGSGWAVDEVARRLRGAHGGIACGCDLSEGMLRQRDGGPRNAAFAAASAQALPYRDGSFDAVLCTAAFHHFPEPLEALREMRRVLRPGGQLLIADPCRDQSLGVWIWDRLHRWFERGHVTYYRTDELRRLLAAAGFTSIEVVALNPSYAEAGKFTRRAALFAAIAPGSGRGLRRPAGAAAGVGAPEEAMVMAGRDSVPAVGPRLLELLACARTKAPLRYDHERRELISEQAGLAYPVREGIPILLAGEARPLEGEARAQPGSST